MGRGQRRKCKCCRRLFRPDPRNRHHQRYCSKPRCRAASKSASQVRWLAQPENNDYFRRPVHLARCQVWRARHPAAALRSSMRSATTLSCKLPSSATGRFVRSSSSATWAQMPSATSGGSEVIDFSKEALRYAGIGWCVFPLGQGSKMSAIKGGHGAKDASLRPDNIRAWGRRYARANIGVACGASRHGGH